MSIEQITMTDIPGRQLMGVLDPTRNKVRTQQFFWGAVEIVRPLYSKKMKMKPRCGACVLGPTWMTCSGVHVGSSGYSCPCEGEST